MSENGFLVGDQQLTPFPYKIYPTLMQNSPFLVQKLQKTHFKGLNEDLWGDVLFEEDYLLQR
jgi:hypothetical protein